MSTSSNVTAAASSGGVSSDGRGLLHNQMTAASATTSNVVELSDAANMTSSRSGPTSPPLSLYLNPDYVQPLSTCLDSKNSPLALLAQTCSSIGRDPATTSATTSSATLTVPQTMTSSAVSAGSSSATSRLRAKCITSSVGLTPTTNSKTGKNYNERKSTAENTTAPLSQSQMTQHKQVGSAKTKPSTGNNMVSTNFGANSSSSNTVMSSSLAPKGSDKSPAISGSSSNFSTGVTVTGSNDPKLQISMSDHLNNNLFPVSVPSSMLDKFSSVSVNATSAGAGALYQDVLAMQALHSALYGAPLNSAAAAAMFANSFPYRSDIVAAAAAAAAAIGGAYHPGSTGDSPTRNSHPLDSVTNASNACLIPGYDCRGNATIERMMNAATGRLPPELIAALSRNHGVFPGLGMPNLPTQNGISGSAAAYQCSWFHPITGEFCRKQYSNFSELADHLRSHVNEAVDPLPAGQRSKTGSTSPSDKYLTQQKSPLASLSDSPGSAAHAYRHISSLQHPLTALPLLPPPLPAELGVRFSEPTMDYQGSRYSHPHRPNHLLTDPTNSITLFHQLNLAASSSSSSSSKSRPFLSPSYRYHPYHRAPELSSSLSSVLSSTAGDDGVVAGHFSAFDSLPPSLLSAYMTSPFGLPAMNGSQRFGSSAAAVPL